MSMIQDMARVLGRAIELIAPQGAWVRGSAALDADGFNVLANSPTAERFCAVGAICHAAFELFGDFDSLNTPIVEALVDRLNAEVAAKAGFTSVTSWNDSSLRSQEGVVAELRRVHQELVAA